MQEHITTDAREQSHDPNQWGRVPLWWLQVLRMKRNALAVSVSLSCHADKTNRAWPSPETIAKETGIDRSHVFKAIKVLKDVGIITESKRRYHDSTVHRLRYKVAESATTDRPQAVTNSPNDRAESATPHQSKVADSGESSGRYHQDKVAEARYTNRSSIRSMNRSRSIDGLQKITFSIDEGLEGERGFALIGLVRELNGSDLAKAKADAKALSRRAKGDLDLAYEWLKYAAHQGKNNPFGYAMSCVAAGAYPPTNGANRTAKRVHAVDSEGL